MRLLLFISTYFFLQLIAFYLLVVTTMTWVDTMWILNFFKLLVLVIQMNQCCFLY